MEQNNNNTVRKKRKHIMYDDRIVIERMMKAKCKKAEIWRVIGCSERTLRREIARGTWIRKDYLWRDVETYTADYAQLMHEKRGKNKGRYAKINDAPKLRAYLEEQIKKEKYSPEAALNKAKETGIELEFDPSVKSVYNWIDGGEIGIKRKDLLRKQGWKQDKSKQRKAHNNLKGEGIEKRPEKANKRSEYGHWEIDLVIGKMGTKYALLTLTERMTRQEIIIRIPNKRKRTIVRALDRLERRYGEKFKDKFKTITADNGSEFLDFELLEKSAITDEKRFKMYYAHPFSSWERGTNENANGIIRRFFPKGTDFSKVSLARIQQVEDWMNNYPRPILGGISANSFLKQVA